MITKVVDEAIEVAVHVWVNDFKVGKQKRVVVVVGSESSPDRSCELAEEKKFVIAK